MFRSNKHMYRCNKCKTIFTDYHKDYDCKKVLIDKIINLIEKCSINKLLLIYNFIKSE
jgi:hypothetical protein